VPPTSSKAKPATATTQEVNKQYADFLSFADTQDFEDARRGLIATLPDPGVIPGPNGATAWDLQPFAFVNGGPENNSPATVNPGLWRHAKLNMNHGLFKVTDGIWQVRGYDLSVMSIIQGDNGWIVVDPLLTSATSSYCWRTSLSRIWVTSRSPTSASRIVHCTIPPTGR
jgi:alkyl sulfatase BDS1-like metallo-beta-lactamase superfamily hydrolase